MGNHIHLLIQEGKEPIEQVMKRIATRFVYWYNIKYQRAGHLFQDRFKSEPVETDEYFLTVLRYIHQNPVKAGICKAAEQYPFSSMGEYLRIPFLVDIDFAFSIISKEQWERVQELRQSKRRKARLDYPRSNAYRYGFVPCILLRTHGTLIRNT